MVLEEHGDYQKFAAGDIIFVKGEPASEMFVIDTGSVEIVGHSDGHDVTLSKLGPEDIFGEMALFGGGPRSATARAVEDTGVRVIAEQDIDSLVPDPLARRLLGVLSQRLRDVDGKLSHMTAQGDIRREHVMDLYDFRSRYG
jgi:CRP-like cAMP-binding protein